MDTITSEVFNEDCLEAMQQYPDNHFDLAVVDPPYGIGEGSERIKSRHHSQKKYKLSNWDNLAPNSEYFDLLKRKSKNQIIWGANHFLDNISYNISSPCWIVWDKDTGSCDFADAELALTSFKTAVRIFKFTWNGFRTGYEHKNKEVRIHATQKPVALYDWIFKNYSTEGMKILDTHLGSQSSRISAYKYKMDFTGYELDKDYFDQGCKRFEDFKSQLRLF